MIRVAFALVLGGAMMATPGEAQRVFVHGYATQAFGQTSEFAQVGLAPDATADMRSAALQVRVVFMRTGTQIVAQAAHRRVGGSVLAPLLDDVELDWGFAQQRVRDFTVRAGRIPLPKGLVNERRDVGTLLPFYQASKAYYTDGIETIDGGVLGYSRPFGDFDVEVQAVYGTIPVVIALSGANGPTAIDVDGEDTRGGQLSVGLPLPGTRLIGGFMDSDVPLVGAQGPYTLDWEQQWVGAEYQADRFFGRAEQGWSLVPGFQDSWTRYVQAGANVWKDLWINAQRERSHTVILSPPLVDFAYDPITDWAVGLSYAYSPNLTIKGEQHWSNGYSLDQFVNITGPAMSNRYFLLSVSAAF